MSGISLYDIHSMVLSAIAEGDQWAAEHGGEVDESLEAKLNALQLAEKDKLAACVGYYKNMNAEMEAFALEIERLGKRMDSAKKSADWMKQYIGIVVGAGNRFEATCGKVSWRASKSTVVDNETLLPPEAYTIVPETKKISLTNVKELIEKGVIGEGVAHIQEKQNIQIR